MKRALLAIATVTALCGAPEAAQATQTECLGDPAVCFCNADSLYYSVSNTVNNVALLSVLETLIVDHVYLVNVEEALNGDIIDILNFYQTDILHNLNVLALQHVLSQLVVVAAGDDLVSLEGFLNANTIGIHDIISVDLLSGNQIVIFHQ
ncbi:hypothetical protein [Chondromyces crocatus]|nr:hypothetical protein [Chondromyces crocatus]